MRRLLGASALAAALAAAAPVPAVAAQEGAAAPRPPDVREVARRQDDLYTSAASVARVEMTTVTPRRSRTLRMRMWSRGRTKALILIEAPARDAGTATLRIERNLWNYLPRISRTIRVPPSMMLSRWMGSDVTNDDLTRSSSWVDDFEGRVVGRTRNGRGWLVRYDARRGTVGLWRRVETVVDDALLPIRSRFFDRRGRLARTMEFRDVREMGGRRIPTRIVITPNDRPGHRTELRYLEIDFDADMPESTFSLSQLERRR